MKQRLEATEEQIDTIDPSSGPWTVEVWVRLFRYAPNAREDGSPLGFALARSGQVIELQHYDDLVRGLRTGAFVDPATAEPAEPEPGPGDVNAREDLVAYVKEHKTDDILARVGSDPDMAALMLDAELAAKPNSGEPRKGVVAGLTKVISDYMNPEVPPAPSAEGTAIPPVPDETTTGDTTVTPPEPENENGSAEDNNSEKE